MQISRHILLLMLVVVAICAQGCIVAAVGAGAAGTVAYIRGDLEAFDAKRLDAVYAASKQAVQQLELTLTRDSKDATSALIIARDAQDTKITIKLNVTEEGPTAMSIRAGFGDETKSRIVYDKIKENLE